MAQSYSRVFPQGTERITTGCQYCAVGCGYNAFLIPENATGSENVDGVSRFITPAMRSRVKFKGVEHEISVAPDVRCDLNKGNHSVRGGSQGENLVTHNGKGRSTEDRLKSPMVRLENGDLQKISWSALNELLAGLVQHATGMKWDDANQKIEIPTPEAVGAKVFEYQYLENTYAFTKLFYSALGTPNVAYHDRPSSAGSSPGMKDAGLRPHDWAYEETIDSDVLVFVGTNPYENQSVYFMQYAVGKKMVVVDPRVTATAQYALDTGGIHVQLPKLGVDPLVIYGICREILVKWKSQPGNSLANYPWRDLVFTDDDELKEKGERRINRARKFDDFANNFLKVDDCNSIYALEKIVENCFGGDAEVLQSLRDFAAAIYPDKIGEDEHYRRVGLIYEKGMIWGFNYHNTAAMASLGLLLGAGEDPATDPDKKGGRFVGRVGGHQKGWADSRVDLSEHFAYPNAQRTYSKGYPKHNATDSYTDGNNDPVPKLVDLPTQHNLDNHLFGPPAAMDPQPDGNSFVKLTNGLRTKEDPDVKLLHIIGGNYFGQTNDAENKRGKIEERLKKGGTGGNIRRPTKADVGNPADLLKVYTDRMSEDGGLVMIFQDLFENPTSSLCDILIPAAGWGEDDFCRYNAQRRFKLYGRFQDPPLDGDDLKRIETAAGAGNAKGLDPAAYWDIEDQENAGIYQHSPKPDWMIFRDLGKALIRSVVPQNLRQGWCEALFGWKESAHVADEMAVFSNRGLANPDKKNRTFLGDLILFGRHKLGLQDGVVHEMLGAGRTDALAPRLNTNNYAVTGIAGDVSDSGIHGNQIASNGVLLPVRGVNGSGEDVDTPVVIEGASVEDALQAAAARGAAIEKLHGTLRVRRNGPFNFVAANWESIKSVFDEINQRDDNQLFITNGRFNHLWNNMFHHLRNDYVNERYPEDMPGTILEVNPDWAGRQNPKIGSGDVVRISSKTEVRPNQFKDTEFKAVVSLQESVPDGGAFAMFSYPVRENGKFKFTGFVNNVSHGYADGINPIGALKYGKATVRKIVGESPYESATRPGPSYQRRNQIQKPPQRDLDLEMRELIVTKGLPRAFVHGSGSRQQSFLNPDELFALLKSDGALRRRFLSNLPRMEYQPPGSQLIDDWSQREIDLATRWANSLGGTTPPPPTEPQPPTPTPPTITGYKEVQALLDKVVGGPTATVGFHGAFWRTMSHQRFVTETVIGVRLVVPGDVAGSGLIDALRGRGEFDGSSFPRMPAGGLAAMPEADIVVIENWIAAGAPEFASEDLGVGIDSAAPAAASDTEHNAYWRDFDDWSLIARPPEVDAAIARIFGMAGQWRAMVRGTGSEADWEAAVRDADNVSALKLLSRRQIDTVVRHYGNPVRLGDLLTSCERFGSDVLPDDPERPSEPKHNMNGPRMWFLWAAFLDAVLRLDIEPVFWHAQGRAMLLGALNDGVHRGRFNVNGFSADAQGSDNMRRFAESLPDGDLTRELASRYRQSGLDFPVPANQPLPGGGTQRRSFRIFPPIGIARVGNSASEFFVGPEAPGIVPDGGGSYRDGTAEKRLKRQGARFRIYEYLTDEFGDSQLVREVTDADAKINWSVHLVNRKAAGEIFPPTAQHHERNSGEADRSRLVIDGGVRSVSGSNQASGDIQGMFRTEPVKLGNLLTDENGRLIVLGGHGLSRSVPAGAPLDHFANNNDWYDDLSDGPVTATVKFGNQEAIPVEPAWVVVASPAYAPAIENIMTWHDQALDIAIRFFNPSAGLAQPSFTRDIYPILERLSLLQWVNSTARNAHGRGRSLDFLRPDVLVKLADKSNNSKTEREGIFNVLVEPGTRAPGPEIRPSGPRRMPFLFSGVDPSEVFQFAFASVTALQFQQMSRWASGDFDADWTGSPPSPVPFGQIPLDEQPDALTRAALEGCIGGPFFPGIESGFLMAQQSTYEAPFRIRRDLQPGALTEWMALPWQADFEACGSLWWPAQRPVSVKRNGAFANYVDGVSGFSGMVRDWWKLGFILPEGDEYTEQQREL